MRLVEILLLMTGIIWAGASVYLIYSLGLALLTVSIGPAITGILIFIFATAAEFLAAILNE